MAKTKRTLKTAGTLDKKKRFRNITDEEEKLRQKMRQEDAKKPIPIRVKGKTKL